MRILDEIRDNSVEQATLLLTRAEAEELHDSLQSLLENAKGQHVHISSNDYQKEITVAIYDPNHLDGFHPRCQKLIRENI